MFSSVLGGSWTTGSLEVIGATTFYHLSNPFPVIGLFGRYMLGGVGCLRHSVWSAYTLKRFICHPWGCSFLDLLKSEPWGTALPPSHSAHVPVCSHWTAVSVQGESSSTDFFPFGHFLLLLFGLVSGSGCSHESQLAHLHLRGKNYLAVTFLQFEGCTEVSGTLYPSYKWEVMVYLTR